MLHTRARVRLVLPLLLAGAATAPGCAGGDDPRLPDAALLRARFPEQAARVLSAGEALVPAAGGFAPAEASGRALAIELPRDASAPVRFHLPAGDIAVREAGLAGEGTVAEQAVAYRRAGGTSYWTAIAGGAEEWLHLEATHRGEAAASWEITGASLRQAGDAIELVDTAGRTALVVSAPAAFAAGGRPVGARVEAHGARVDLFVDADGEAVLVDPMWIQVGSLGIGRTRHAAALVSTTGLVLVCGGAAVNYCELYDHSAGSFAMGPSMTYRRQDLTATPLPDGRVVIIGGALGNSAPVQAEVYDPMTGMITVSGSMAAPRQNHTATLLPNGKILVAGGIPPFTTGAALATAEIYDPTSGMFKPTGSLAAPRGMHTATLLANGTVLVTGGNTVSGSALAPVATAEIYDPATGIWSPTGAMTQPRQYHTATRLSNGGVLVAGGNGASITATAEIYSPATGMWAPTGSMAYPRWEHMALALGNGQVLVVGGAGSMVPLPGNISETYDPATGMWSFAGSLVTSHALGTLTKLTSGTVLLAGGQTFISEEYNTQSGIGTPCTVGGECKSGFCADGVCCVSACNQPCYACSAAKGAVADGNCTPLSGTPCDDGDACSIGDVCAAGTCQGGTPKQCIAMDTCHVAGTCDPLTGQCSQPKKPEGTPCSDGDACTQGDYCSGGVCVAGSAVVCTPPDTCHEGGSCNPATGMCQFSAKPDGTACDDGNACTQTDTCIAGACVGKNPVICPEPDACHVATPCDKISGQCGLAPRPDGTSCDDNDPCTTGDHCVSGACQAGTPVACKPSDECHIAGTCSLTTGGCSNPTQPDGAPCTGGMCIAGKCETSADAGPTGGSGGAGGESSSSSSGGTGEKAGCGCEAAGAPGAGGLGWAAAILALAASRRRRR
jgi:MYXO-CTERM domain-containing protein